MDNSFKEDDVEKELAFLAKNFQKFQKMNKSGKPFNKGKFFHLPRVIGRNLGRKMEMSLNLLKESLASSAMDMDMSRENVLII